MKKSLQLLTLVASCFSLTTYAQIQNFNVKWQDKYQHTTVAGFSNEARKLVSDPSSGEVFMLSDVTSDLNQFGVPTANIYHYVVLNKYDSTGTLLGSVSINVSEHESNGFDLKSSFGMSLDGSGNVYIGYMNLHTTTDFDVNISKYTAALAHVWTYKYNGSTKDEGISLQVTNAGMAYALVKSVSSSNIPRYRIIRANAQGTSATPFYSFTPGNDVLNSLALDNSGNAYVTGYQLLGVGGQHLMTASIGTVGSNGVLRWISVDSCLTLAGDDVGRYVSIGADGYTYVTGASQGSVSHGVDAVIVKYGSATGKRAWIKYINYTLSDGGFFVMSSDVNLIYVGWKGGSNAYVEEMSAANGNSWRRATYSPQPNQPYTSINGISLADMKISVGKNVYLTGTVHAQDNSKFYDAPFLIKVSFASRGAAKVELAIPVDGDFNSSRKSVAMALNNYQRTVYHACSIAEDYDTHLSESAEITSLGGMNLFRHSPTVGLSSEINVYPNPVSDFLMIRGAQTAATLKLFNAIGKDVTPTGWNQDVSSPEVKMDLRTLPKGIYLLKLISQNGTEQVRKIIKD